MRRSNGTGSVVKLGGKRRRKYAARVCTGQTIGPSGKVICQYQYLAYTETAKEAQEILDRCTGSEEVVKRLQHVSVKSNPTFATVYDETISKSSLNNIKNLLHKMYHPGLKKKYVDEDISRLCDYDYKTPGDVYITKKNVQKLSMEKPRKLNTSGVSSRSLVMKMLIL